MKKYNRRELIIIVPAHNEELRLPNLSHFKKLAKNAPLCFVDDGSSDNTLKVIADLAKKVNGLALNLPTNVGKAEAIRQAYQYINKQHAPRFVGYLDADFAFSELSIKNFVNQSMKKLELEQSLSAVISSRVNLSGRKIERSKSRHYISRILITIIGIFIHNLPYDSQSGLKIFRNSRKFKASMSKSFKTKWFFDIELLIRTDSLSARKLWEEPILEWKDIAGSHLTMKKIPKLILEIFQIIQIGRSLQRKH